MKVLTDLPRTFTDNWMLPIELIKHCYLIFSWIEDAIYYGNATPFEI